MSLNSSQKSLLAKAYAQHQRGRIAQADAIYERLLRVAPDDPQLVHLAGIAAAAMGRLQVARTLLDKAVSIDTTNAIAYNDLGGVLKALGQLPGALASYARALAISPNFAEAYHNRAGVLIQLNCVSEAMADFDRAIAIKPDYANAYRNRGEARHAIGATNEALSDIERAIALRPDFAAAHLGRGRILRALGRQAEAAAAFGRSAMLNPSDPTAHFLHGTQLGHFKRYSAALRSLDTALELNLVFIEALITRAGVLLYLDRPDDAIADCQRALALDPSSAAAYNNLGIAHRARREDCRALAAFRKAIDLQPDYATGHWNEAVVLLQTQDFPAGWVEHEWRWAAPDSPPRRSFTQPLWLGDVDISDRTLFVHWEQGLGDTIQFFRFVPIAAARCKKLVISVQDSLRPLLSRMADDIEMVDGSEIPPDFDYHIPLMSLPLALRTDGTTETPATGYLAADPTLVRIWRERLEPRGGRRVGIAWSGNASQDNDRNRSIPLALWAPLLDRNIAWTMLQNTVRLSDAEFLRQRASIDNFTNDVRDFADTAALVDAMELIITVDTSIAHLAAAMGKPVWLLACFNADWRWPRTSDTSKWYPTMRIFHQRAIGDWPELFTRVAAAVDDWLLPPDRALSAPTTGAQL